MQFDKDLSSPHKQLFLKGREILLVVKGVEEFRKDKLTTYSYNGAGLCHRRIMDYGIDIGFLKGAMLKDEPGLLRGETKPMRVLSLEKISKKTLQYYLDQALKLNE